MFAGAKRAEERDSLLALCQELLQFSLFVFLLGKGDDFLMSQITIPPAQTLVTKNKNKTHAYYKNRNSIYFI